MDNFDGKWKSILQACAVGSKHLTGKHTSCPICGGSDRFRFDDKDGKGTWICNNCGAGNGFTLLMLYLKMEFKEALKLVKEKEGVAKYERPKVQRTDEENKASCKKLWDGSKPVSDADFVDKYLSTRGITLRSKSLHKHFQCYSSHGKTFPAMLALVKDFEGKGVTIHRTYLTLEGRKQEIDSCRELMSGKIPEGSAIRLMEPTLNLGIAEGIETALSAAQLFGIPVWSAINAVLLEKWVPPEAVTNIFIFGDSDTSYAGQKSAYVLANKLAIKGLSVQVHIPNSGDWNDEIMKTREAA